MCWVCRTYCEADDQSGKTVACTHKVILVGEDKQEVESEDGRWRHAACPERVVPKKGWPAYLNSTQTECPYPVDRCYLHKRGGSVAVSEIRVNAKVELSDVCTPTYLSWHSECENRPIFFGLSGPTLPDLITLVL